MATKKKTSKKKTSKKKTSKKKASKKKASKKERAKPRFVEADGLHQWSDLLMEIERGSQIKLSTADGNTAGSWMDQHPGDVWVLVDGVRGSTVTGVVAHHGHPASKLKPGTRVELQKKHVKYADADSGGWPPWEELTFKDAKSNKFWRIRSNDKGWATWANWGRIGTEGQHQLISHGSQDGAFDYEDKMIREKVAKGYRTTDPRGIELSDGSVIGQRQRAANPKSAFEHGDIVRYTANFLRNTGQIAGSPINGRVEGDGDLTTKDGVAYPMVRWNDRDELAMVHPGNLEYDPRYSRKNGCPYRAPKRFKYEGQHSHLPFEHRGATAKPEGSIKRGILGPLRERKERKRYEQAWKPKRNGEETSISTRRNKAPPSLISVDARGKICARPGPLSSSARKDLPSWAFGLPGDGPRSERKYPLYKIVAGRVVPSKTHASNAKGRAKQGLDSGDLTKAQYNAIVKAANAVIKMCQSKKNPPSNLDDLGLEFSPVIEQGQFEELECVECASEIEGGSCTACGLEVSELECMDCGSEFEGGACSSCSSRRAIALPNPKNGQRARKGQKARKGRTARLATGYIGATGGGKKLPFPDVRMGHDKRFGYKPHRGYSELQVAQLGDESVGWVARGDIPVNKRWYPDATSRAAALLGSRSHGGRRSSKKASAAGQLMGRVGQAERQRLKKGLMR